MQDNNQTNSLGAGTYMKTETKKVSITAMKWFPWLVCLLGAAFYSYEYFLRISPSVMSADLMQAYGISAEALGGLSAVYYYAYTPMQLPIGVLMDRFGPKRLLAFACLACALGSYVFAHTHSLYLANLGRFVVGFGSAFAFVGVLKLATIWLPPERFALISGLTAALGTIGAMFGDVALSKLVEFAGWRYTVGLTAMVGLVLTVILFIVIKDRNPNQPPSQVTTEVGFRENLINLVRVLKNPQIWINGAIGCLLYLPTTAFAEMWGIPYLRTTYHLSAVDGGFINAAIFLGFTIGAPLSGAISDKLRRRSMTMMCGGLLAAAIMAVILYVPDLSRNSLVALMFLLGMSYSVQVIVFAVGREVSSPKAAATAIAATNMFVMIGGVISQPLVGRLLDLRWDGTIVNNLHIYTVADYRFALSVLPAGLLLGVILTFFLKETHGKLRKD